MQHPEPRPQAGQQTASLKTGSKWLLAGLVCAGLWTAAHHIPEKKEAPKPVAATAPLSLSGGTLYSGAEQTPPSTRDRPCRLNRLASPALIYPVSMQRAGITGAATIHCHVTATGRATTCAITHSTGTAFGTEALRYAKSAVYFPEIRNGRLVDSEKSLTVNFALTP